MKLFINTCFETVLIGLLSEDGEDIIALRSWKADRQESKKLTPRISEMIKDNGFSKNDISSVNIVTGPGSFTAIRIGFIVGKSFSASLGVDLFECNSFEYISALMKEKFDFGFIKAGRKMIYRFDLSNSEFELIEERSPESNEVDTSEIDMETVFKNSFKDLIPKMRLVENLETFEPNYIREPNINIPKG